MSSHSIREIRAFNRWYTDLIGLLNKHLPDSEYSLAEARILFEINARGAIRASQLMTILHIDKSYLSRLLRELGEAKLIIRKRSPDDARAMLLSLSGKGQRVFAALNDASDQQVGRLLQPLNEEQRLRLAGHMHGIRGLIQAETSLPAKVAIRTTLKPGDLGYVAWLHGRLYDKEHGYGIGFESYVLKGLGEFGLQYDAAKDRVWVCQDGQRIVGFLAGVRRDAGSSGAGTVNRGDSLQLRYFILLPEYRGRGLGKHLMDLFIGFLRERNYRYAFLWTTNEQRAAIALYMRYGFRLTEEKISVAFGKSLSECKYELRLGGNSATRDA